MRRFFPVSDKAATAAAPYFIPKAFNRGRPADDKKLMSAKSGEDGATAPEDLFGEIKSRPPFDQREETMAPEYSKLYFLWVGLLPDLIYSSANSESFSGQSGRFSGRPLRTPPGL